MLILFSKHLKYKWILYEEYSHWILCRKSVSKYQWGFEGWKGLTGSRYVLGCVHIMFTGRQSVYLWQWICFTCWTASTMKIVHCCEIQTTVQTSPFVGESVLGNIVNDKTHKYWGRGECCLQTPEDYFSWSSYIQKNEIAIIYLWMERVCCEWVLWFWSDWASALCQLSAYYYNRLNYLLGVLRIHLAEDGNYLWPLFIEWSSVQTNGTAWL